jgi:hypothetical protein
MENVIIKKIMIKYGCNKMIKLKRLNKNVWKYKYDLLLE